MNHTVPRNNKVRPIYESDADKERERGVAREIAARIHPATLVESPRYHPYDFTVVIHGFPVGVVEVKCRTHRFGYHPDLILSKRRYDELASIPVPHRILAVRYENGIYLHRIAQNNRHSSYAIRERGGRTTNARDKWDVEPVYQIPLFHFESLIVFTLENNS